MRPTDRNGIAVIVAVALASLTVRPLTVDANFVVLSWLLIGLLGGIGIALRRSRFGASMVLAAQSVGLVLFSLGLSGMMPIFGLRWFENYPALWAAGVEHMRTSSSPMEPDDGVRLIFVTVVGIIMIMTDLLVSGLGRPAWALAPPATLFLVPALGLGIDTGIANFCFIAIGYLAILVAEALEHDGALDARAVPRLGRRIRHGLLRGLASHRVSRHAGIGRGDRARCRAADPVAAGVRLRQRSGQRTVATDRPDPRPAAKPHPARRPGGPGVPIGHLGRPLPADGHACPSSTPRGGATC